MNQVQEFVIGKGGDIKQTIASFMREQGWEYAYISGAVGSVIQVSLTTPVGSEYPPRVEITPCDGPGEILAFTGEVMPWEQVDPDLPVARDDTPMFIHIHASVATAGGKVSGGGLREGKAWRALKVYIQQTNEKVWR